MRYVRGNQEINVSKGAYKSIYKGMGFMPVDTEGEEAESDMIEVTNGDTTLLLQKTEYEKTYKEIGFMPVDEYSGGGSVQDESPQDLSTTKLKAMAKEKEIPGYSKMSRDELIEALFSNELLNEEEQDESEATGKNLEPSQE